MSFVESQIVVNNQENKTHLSEQENKDQEIQKSIIDLELKISKYLEAQDSFEKQKGQTADGIYLTIPEFFCTEKEEIVEKINSLTEVIAQEDSVSPEIVELLRAKHPSISRIFREIMFFIPREKMTSFFKTFYFSDPQNFSQEQRVKGDYEKSFFADFQHLAKTFPVEFSFAGVQFLPEIANNPEFQPVLSQLMARFIEENHLKMIELVESCPELIKSLNPEMKKEMAKNFLLKNLSIFEKLIKDFLRNETEEEDFEKLKKLNNFLETLDVDELMINSDRELGDLARKSFQYFLATEDKNDIFAVSKIQPKDYLREIGNYWGKVLGRETVRKTSEVVFRSGLPVAQFRGASFVLGNLDENIYQNQQVAEYSQFLLEAMFVKAENLILREGRKVPQLIKHTKVPVEIVEKAFGDALKDFLVNGQNRYKQKVAFVKALNLPPDFWQDPVRQELLRQEYRNFLLFQSEGFGECDFNFWQEIKTVYHLKQEDFPEEVYMVYSILNKENITTKDVNKLWVFIEQCQLAKDFWGLKNEDLFANVKHLEKKLSLLADSVFVDDLEETKNKIRRLEDLGFSYQEFLERGKTGNCYFQLSFQLAEMIKRKPPEQLADYYAFLQSLPLEKDKILVRVFLLKDLKTTQRVANGFSLELSAIDLADKLAKAEKFGSLFILSSKDQKVKLFYEEFLQKKKKEYLSCQSEAEASKLQSELKALYSLGGEKIILEILNNLNRFLGMPKGKTPFPKKEMELMLGLGDEFLPWLHEFYVFANDDRVPTLYREKIFDRFCVDSKNNEIFNSEVLRSYLKENKEYLLKPENTFELEPFFAREREINNQEIKNRYVRREEISLWSFWGKNQRSIIDWHGDYPGIPLENILPLATVTDVFDPTNPFLEKFEKFSIKVAKSERATEQIQYFLANTPIWSKTISAGLDRVLREIDFGQDISEAFELKEIGSYLQMMNSLKTAQEEHIREQFYGYGGYDDYDEYFDQQAHFNSLVVQFEKRMVEAMVGATNLKELKEKMENFCLAEFRSLFANNEISTEKINSVKKAWGENLEPIMTYLVRYPELADYLIDLFEHFDSSTSWQNYRYDLSRNSVKEQVGWLSPAQLELWKRNFVVELGELTLAERNVDPALKTKEIIFESVLRQGHLLEGDDQKKHLSLQEYLSAIFTEIEKRPVEQQTILEGEKQEILWEMTVIDKIFEAEDAERVQTIWKEKLAGEQEFSFNAKTEKIIKDLAKYLDVADAKNFLEEYLQKSEQAKKDKNSKFFVKDLITEERRKKIVLKISQKKAEALVVLENVELLKKFSLPVSEKIETKDLFARRKELTIKLDLLALVGIDKQLLLAGKLHHDGKKDNEQLIKSLKNLKAYFQGVSFLGDLENIENLIDLNEDISVSKKLAFLSTDEAQMLFNVGVYPLGNGSCQNYFKGTVAEALLGYVGDAHSRALYVLDLNKLSDKYAEIVAREGITALLDNDKIPQKEVLESVIARSILKLSKNGCLFMEPIYTVLNKGDVSLRNKIITFLQKNYGQKMQIDLAVGAGDYEITVPASANPEGQYEDSGVNYDDYVGIGKMVGEYSLRVGLVK